MVTRVRSKANRPWTHSDVLRLAHPIPSRDDVVRRELFRYLHGGKRRSNAANMIPIVEGFERAKTAPIGQIPALIRRYRLTWEMLSDEARAEPKTWEALLDNGMPPEALMRNLPTLTNLRVLAPFGKYTAQVAAQLTDAQRLTRARVHPASLLLNQFAYARGISVDKYGTITNRWQPLRKIVDALDLGFYRAFGAVEPTGKNILIGLDFSGSMKAKIAGTDLSARTASTAMALVTANVEPNVEIVGFTCSEMPGAHCFPTSPVRFGWDGKEGTNAIIPLNISPRQRIDDVIRYTDGIPFGGTDIALPMLYALHHKMYVDAFVIYTDNENWAGKIHPYQALRQYRETINPRAKLVVVAMAANSYTVADPNDGGSADFVGFDGGTPALIADFIAN